ECSQKAFVAHDDASTAVQLQRTLHDLGIGVLNVAPTAFAYTRHDLRSVGDFHRQHGCQHAVGLGGDPTGAQEVLDGGEDLVLVAEEGQVLVSRQFDVFGARDMGGHI